MYAHLWRVSHPGKHGGSAAPTVGDSRRVGREELLRAGRRDDAAARPRPAGAHATLPGRDRGRRLLAPRTVAPPRRAPGLTVSPPSARACPWRTHDEEVDAMAKRVADAMTPRVAT